MIDFLSVTNAASIAAAGFIVIAAFQAALALGAPLGRAAWGGAHRVLPTRLRWSSAVAVVIWAVAARLVLERAGVIQLGLPDVVAIWGSWIIVGASVLGALVNVASSSPWERFGWAPFAAILALLSLRVALAA